MVTRQEERDAALVGYKAARDGFAVAQEEWDPFLVAIGKFDIDSAAADAAFDRFRKANQASQDAVNAPWAAWRNRPEPPEESTWDGKGANRLRACHAVRGKPPWRAVWAL